MLLFIVSRFGFDVLILGIALGVGVYLLILPAYRLYQTTSRRDAMRLFNKASYYPLALLGLVFIWVIF